MEATLGYYASYFTDREFKIAEIMVELPDIISQLDYRPRIRVPWGHKKKRSALAVHDQKVRNKSTVLRLRLASSSSSPNPGAKIRAANVVKVERASPNTPLSFESDDKPNHLRSKLLLGKRVSVFVSFKSSSVWLCIFFGFFFGSFDFWQFWQFGFCVFLFPICYFWLWLATSMILWSCRKERNGWRR